MLVSVVGLCMSMSGVEEILTVMKANPAGVRFTDACKVARQFFGGERRHGSHHIWKMKWPGDPRVNLQKGSGDLAKDYQVKQLLAAVDKEKQRLEDIAKTTPLPTRAKPGAIQSEGKRKTIKRKGKSK